MVLVKKTSKGNLIPTSSVAEGQIFHLCLSQLQSKTFFKPGLLSSSYICAYLQCPYSVTITLTASSCVHGCHTVCMGQLLSMWSSWGVLQKWNGFLENACVAQKPGLTKICDFVNVLFTTCLRCSEEAVNREHQAKMIETLVYTLVPTAGFF